MGQYSSNLNCPSVKLPKSKGKNKKKLAPKSATDKTYLGLPGSYLVQAKYKYTASGDTDISFDAKEYMYVVKQFDEFWLQVVKQVDNSTGMVPANYVSKQDGSPESTEAWKDIQRWEAEKLLMRVGLKTGTYLIRPSRRENSFALSLRDYDEKKKIAYVKHYQIKTEKEGDKTTYIINVRAFPDMITLIKFYEKNGIGLAHVPLNDVITDNYQPPIHFQDIEINRENLEIMNEIGKGCFGSVHKAKWGRSFEVAVKMLQSPKADREKFLQEAKIMHKLRHRKIVELLGVCTEPMDMPLMIVVEYMKNGSLKEYLRTPVGHKTSYMQMIHFMADISEGMAYLEKEKVVHRDLRADNILVSDVLSGKVADFGLTECMEKEEDDQGKKNAKFPFKWTAPEAAKTKIFTSKSDVWSFGVVMYEILTWASSPYPDMTGKEVIEKVSNGYRMPNPEETVPDCKCPVPLYEHMLKTWSEDPTERPPFGKLQEIFDNLIVEAKDNYDE